MTIPLIAFRLFAPSEVFPITYRRGRSAHLDVTGARGVAIRRGLEDQLGLVVEDLTPFGLAGSAGSTPLRIKLSGDPPTYLFGKLYARSHLRADRCTSWAEAPHVLGFTTRAALQQALSQRSGGRLQLDPEQAR